MKVSVQIQAELHELICDELLIPIFTGEELAVAQPALDDLFEGSLTQMQQDKEISAEAKSVSIIYTLGKLKAKKLVFVGLGDKAELTFVKARNAFARAVKTLSGRGANKTVAVSLTGEQSLPIRRLAQAITEAFTLAAYTYEGYREKPKREQSLEYVTLYVSERESTEATEGATLGTALATGTNLARNLINEPSNYLTPTALKDSIVEMAERYKMSYEVLAKDKLIELGMGGVLSVAQGSAEQPYVVIVRYQGKETWDNVIGLIGKGVTFDTGGISIKPVAGMEDMKSDMGGSAAMIGVMEAIGRLQPRINLLLVVGCVENMPSGTAFKPGDIITMMSGKTVEIITTDAEGRLVLADCITYAKQLGVECLIDCATLTGGIVVGLGNISTGAMTNNQPMVNELLASAEHAGERLWQLPTFEEYRELNKSRFADLKNSGGRYGHAIIAGVFLQEFVGDTPWVHLDTAGTSYINGATELHPGGGTGAMTRTVAQFLLNRSK